MSGRRTEGGGRSADYDHVLLTRFSAVLHPHAPPATEDWLYYRIGFFVDACLPSVLSQRGHRPFEWLVLLDDRCSDAFRTDVEELAAGAFTPLWSHVPFRRDSFAEPVARRCVAPYLISTRIDSDDAMAVDLMAAVQAQFAGQERMFVNFPRGVQIDRGGAVYRADILSSPFLSLVERRTEDELPATVYVAKHARARDAAPVREVVAPVMWAQVLHGTNLSNIVNGVQVDPRVVGERFRIDLGYDAGVTGARLRREQLRQLGRLLRLWTAHPGELTRWAEARAWTMRGTHVRPQESGAPTLSDKAQAWERRTRLVARDVRWRGTARLNVSARRRSRVLTGHLDEVLERQRVVVLAEWAPSRRLRPDAVRAAEAWAHAGFGVVVAAARNPWTPLSTGRPPPGVAVMRRSNIAYDFGGWAEVLTTWPVLATKPLVVLTNDSLLGPLGPLDELVRRMEASTADVWAPTSNQLPSEHLQSYLLAFRGGVLASPPLKDFFEGVSPARSKTEAVLTYELGLTRVVDRAGLRRAVGWSHAELGAHVSTDLTLGSWSALVAAGFPFVKRVLMTGPQFTTTREEVISLVARLGGHPTTGPPRRSSTS